MKWIIVHSSWDKKPIWLNIERIWRIERGLPDKQRPIDGAWIFHSDQQDDFVRVTETPEEIMAIIDPPLLLASKMREEI